MGRVSILCVWLKYHNHNITYTLKKYTSTMVTSRPRPRFAISQRILLLFFTSNERRSPYKRAQLTLCSDPHGKEKPLSSPSRETVDSDVRHHQIPAIQEDEQGHFLPCRLLSLTPSVSFEGGRKWGCL